MILSQFVSKARTTSVCMYGSHAPVPVCRELSQNSAIPCNFLCSLNLFMLADRYTLYSETVSDPGYESEEERLPTSALIKPPPRQAPSALRIIRS
jgi:hypothetical protein